MRTTIRHIGNSRGVIIPALALAQAGLSHETNMIVERDGIVLRRPLPPARAGWAEAARRIAAAGDDILVMGDAGNAADDDVEW